jgi:hypothetical protein
MFAFTVAIILSTAVSVKQAEPNETSLDHLASGNTLANISLPELQDFKAANGWLVATTTLYDDKTGGACGCFDDLHYSGFSEQWGIGFVHFAALSDPLYQPDPHNGCSKNCGKCYTLVSQVGLDYGRYKHANKAESLALSNLRHGTVCAQSHNSRRL